MSGIRVIIQDNSKHPRCTHGPTLLFSRYDEDRNFFACSACRDRKFCNFFMWQDECAKYSKKIERWKKLEKEETKNINHRNLFITHNEVLKLQPSKRVYCHTCSSFQLPKYQEKHKDHDCINDISDYLMNHPTELLKPLDNSKKEAQYLFSQRSVEVIVTILKELNLSNVLCIGTPRIHEYITSKCDDMNSLLLDVDKRLHHFFGPLQFCWYNSFNHHFFFEGSRNVFEDFLSIKDGGHVIVTDPPFGGRTECLAETFSTINKLYKNIQDDSKDIPIFWIFPYFMEPQILNSFPNFFMLDYQVDYDNHTLFTSGDKGRKLGSPVRIFTNVDPKSIKLPSEDGYKFCKKCSIWVSNENKHCKKCNKCTSKDGRTYVHCKLCGCCVKPTWKHCDKCKKCTLPNHKCQIIEFDKECFHCKQKGHKRKACPDLHKTKDELPTKSKKRKRK